MNLFVTFQMKYGTISVWLNGYKVLFLNINEYIFNLIQPHFIENLK